MPRILADKAVVFFRVDPAVEKQVVSLATSTFQNVVISDAYLVSGYEGEPIKALTVYCDRLHRRDVFDTYVLAVVALIGKSGAQQVLVEINGVGAVYEGGPDYERVVPQETGGASV